MSSLDALLGTTNTYQVKGKGGTPENLKQWVSALEFQGHYWHCQLQGNPQDFLTKLDAVGAQLITLNLARQSLEELFMQQLHQHGIRSSH